MSAALPVAALVLTAVTIFDPSWLTILCAVAATTAALADVIARSLPPR